MKIQSNHRFVAQSVFSQPYGAKSPSRKTADSCPSHRNPTTLSNRKCNDPLKPCANYSQLVELGKPERLGIWGFNLLSVNDFLIHEGPSLYEIAHC